MIGSGDDPIKYLTYFGVYVTPNIFLFSFQTFSWFILCRRCIGWIPWWLLSWYLTCHILFSWCYHLHLSSLLELLILLWWQVSSSPVWRVFLYQLPSASAVHLLLISGPLWMVTGWLLCFLCLISLFLVFLPSYFQKSSFGSSDVAHKNFWFLW